MDKKILAIMVALLCVAGVVAGVALAAGEGGGGGGFSSGGFTGLFDKMEINPDMGNQTYRAYLMAPDSWETNDDVRVTDVIVDMTYDSRTYGNTVIFTTTFWFVYAGDQWNDPARGTYFYVPVEDGWMAVNHGLFTIEVESVTNLSEDYEPGDRITLETNLVLNEYVDIAFGVWVVEDTI